MRTQAAADCKLANAAKAKAAEEKRALAAARRIEMMTKCQDKLICIAEAKSAKATAKAAELRVKLDMVLQSSITVTKPVPSAATAHLHKRSKGVSGTPAFRTVPQVSLYESPQRKGTTANKRASVRSPRQFPFEAAASSDLDSVSAGVLTTGDDSDDSDSNGGWGTDDGSVLVVTNNPPASIRGGRRSPAPRSKRRSISSICSSQESVRSSRSSSIVSTGEQDSDIS